MLLSFQIFSFKPVVFNLWVTVLFHRYIYITTHKSNKVAAGGDTGL